MSGNCLTDEMRKAIKAQLTAAPQRKHQPNRERLVSGNFRPFASEALGCGIDQIEESRAHLRANGIAADFDSDGRLIVTSDKMFQDCAKAFGMKTGRDGYEVKDYEGKTMLTGRRPVEERNKSWDIIREMLNEN